MIFSELYGAYYHTVAKIIKAAVDHPLQKQEIRQIIENAAFGESVLSIAPSLENEDWQLIRRDGTTPIQNKPSMPLTLLQKRWLKAIFLDPRVRLFSDAFPDLPDVEPLFTAEDICVFDRYADGDPYEDERYIQRFRLILDAIEKRYPLHIDAKTRKGNIVHMNLQPEYLEYSEKDDKFRLRSSGCRYGETINLARIVGCMPCTKPLGIFPFKRPQPKLRTVEFELIDRRNALERVLLHFAHFKKQAVKRSYDSYQITVFYDEEDETEMVIRLLSFGPMIKVTAPQHFVELVKERLVNQKSCEH